MRRILSSVTWPALKYFSTFSHNRHHFRKKKVTGHKMCVLIFSTTFFWNISYSEKKWARYDRKMRIGLHVKYPLFLSDCNETWIFSKDWQKYSNIKFHENLSGGSRVVPCGRRDGQAWQTKSLFAILQTRLKTTMPLAVFELGGRPASSVVAVPTTVCYGEISSVKSPVCRLLCQVGYVEC